MMDCSLTMIGVACSSISSPFTERCTVQTYTLVVRPIKVGLKAEAEPIKAAAAAIETFI
jgi:hypothetical protein